ncbi:hypothetical protein HAX54_041003 [Datura stramonium]|uniref:FRIGIDA-like protein n=1 Tax=Datura stramonium TaxID=4076 RepID=A0ABS8VQ14_DATST|nr:hypothetical protein [Datura stramonium]
MNKMKKPMVSAAAAGPTPRSEPPMNTQLVQEEPQQSELQPTHSQELIIANLRKLSDALFAFQRCLSDLEQHVRSVRTSIDSSMLLLLTLPPCTTNTTPPPYMITHLSDINGLREQVPKALNLSPNPARLALECINKGRKRCLSGLRGLASLLTLECLLLMMGEAEGEGRVVEIDKGAKEEAEQVSGAWGVFGVLRRSSVLMEKIPKIIQWMLKNNLVVGAVDIVYTFGMEERFNPRGILTSFLHKSEVSYLKKTKGLEQGIAVRAGKKKHLSNLKSVSECLERQKIWNVRRLILRNSFQGGKWM